MQIKSKMKLAEKKKAQPINTIKGAHLLKYEFQFVIKTGLVAMVFLIQTRISSQTRASNYSCLRFLLPARGSDRCRTCSPLNSTRKPIRCMKHNVKTLDNKQLITVVPGKGLVSPTNAY